MTRVRERFQAWGMVLWILAVPLVFCWVQLTWLNESLHGGQYAPFPFFSTATTGASALTLLVTGIALQLLAGRLSLERAVQLRNQITLTTWLLTALAVAGFIVGILHCP
jgi:hypothetical protein